MKLKAQRMENVFSLLRHTHTHRVDILNRNSSSSMEVLKSALFIAEYVINLAKDTSIHIAYSPCLLGERNLRRNGNQNFIV